MREGVQRMPELMKARLLGLALNRDGASKEGLDLVEGANPPVMFGEPAQDLRKLRRLRTERRLGVAEGAQEELLGAVMKGELDVDLSEVASDLGGLRRRRTGGRFK